MHSITQYTYLADKYLLTLDNLEKCVTIYSQKSKRVLEKKGIT